ncbi:hypothetical protein UFOVP1356_4 [uncultured Caudovirales phage]|uniref:Uncharacterized protein n=1 Tax=uncultured Caudovirales phage TaxID=2100421 RepID=A0A6J5RRE0_9CAUD|nr:hypothetical protein UFOVP1356_4 [uncultured Caudovirales phage]
MSDPQLLRLISSARFELPVVIAKRAGRRSVNAQLGRLIRCGVIERVPGPRCFMYRSRQAALV